MTFDRTADAIGNHRHALRSAEADDASNLLGAFGKNDGIGRLWRMHRFIAAMLEAGGFTCRETLREKFAEGLPKGVGEVADGHERNRVAWSRSV